MNKRIKYGVLLIFFLIVGLTFYGYLSYHRHTLSFNPDLYIDAKDLRAAFENNETAGNNLYLNKRVSVRGVVEKIEKKPSGNYIVQLGNTINGPISVSCHMDSLFSEHPTSLSIGDGCIIFGTCAGYLTDVVLLQCIKEK
jgi:hypothetical protein